MNTRKQALVCKILGAICARASIDNKVPIDELRKDKSTGFVSVTEALMKDDGIISSIDASDVFDLKYIVEEMAADLGCLYERCFMGDGNDVYLRQWLEEAQDIRRDVLNEPKIEDVHSSSDDMSANMTRITPEDLSADGIIVHVETLKRIKLADPDEQTPSDD